MWSSRWVIRYDQRGDIIATNLGPLELALEDPERPRYTTHFATCPDADRWRKPA